MNDFKTDLAWSMSASTEDFWDAVYRKAFPNMVGHIANPDDGIAQRQGVDRHIFLANGKTINIDEKKRREVWSDILLEYVSNDQTNAPGWMDKDLSIDYLAYAFMPTKCCHLLPWPTLRLAWLKHRTDWLSTYPTVPAKNIGYTTLSVAVPIKKLYVALVGAMYVDVSSLFPGISFEN